MLIKRTSVALAVAGALFSAGVGAATNISHPSLTAHLGYKPVDAGVSNPLLAPDGTAAVMIVLQGEPATAAYARALKQGGAGPMALSAANSASKNAVQQLTAQQAAFATLLKASGVKYTEMFRTQRVLNGIAVRVHPADMPKLRSLAGVAHVTYIPLYQRPSNLASVPFVNAPEVWDAVNSLGGQINATGKGIKVGDIDTGLDFVHPDFGGSGLLADYQNIDPTSVTGINTHTPVFPTAKVVGGYDFAGDLYNPNTGVGATPDPNPMDCGGHGSHTAGTIGGVGVKSDGTSYGGAYNPVQPYTAGLRIGPGVAPEADMYALRVFGCGGSTNLVTQAIEWAIDPNGDGDFSDRLDVINMSLGSPFGVDSTAFNTDIEAVNNAAATGMLVVSAAGNSGDTFFINGAPGAANAGLSIAASVDNGQIVPFIHETAPSVADYQAIAFGFSNPDGIPPPDVAGQTGNIVKVIDTTGGASLGCGAGVNDPNAFSNKAAINGNIALIDRGTCSFYVKVVNAQAAGATAVIVADNRVEGLSPVGGPTPVEITIPSVFTTQASGTAIKTALGGGTVSVALNAVAQPQLGDTLAGFSSRGPVSTAAGTVELKPDLAAPGLNIPSVQTGITCNTTTTGSGCITPVSTGFIPGGQKLSISGTSMATPHVAGTMALLRELNPGSTVEELKAMVINSAGHDVSSAPAGGTPLFGQSRVGAGRLDVASAATMKVLAYNADVPDAVNVTFDVEPVGASFSATHNVTLKNRTAIIQKVTLALDTILDAPGIGFSVPSGTISIPPAGTATFAVTLNANTDLMKRYIDPTMSLTQSSAAFSPSYPTPINVPREYIAEESALIKVLDSNSNELARLPVYASNRPHSTMAVNTAVGAGTTASGTAALPLSGADVCTGTRAGGGVCTDNLAQDEESLVSVLELQYTGTNNPALPGFENVHYVGVNSSVDSTNEDFIFGINTFGRWGSQNNMAFNVCVDTDGDGLFDKVLFNSDLGTLDGLFGLSNNGQDTVYSFVYDNVSGNVFAEAPVNLAGPTNLDSGALSNNSMLLAAFGADLGVTAGSTIHYGIAVCPGYNPICGSAGWPASAQGTAHCGAGADLQFDGPIAYNSAAPAVDTAGNALFEDQAGGTLSFNYNVNNQIANGSKGALILHSHNTAATSAQVVVLDRVFADSFGQ